MDKDLKKLMKQLEKQGFEVQRTQKGHIRVLRDGVPVATFASTASDWRSTRNGIAACRRAGFRWP